MRLVSFQKNNYLSIGAVISDQTPIRENENFKIIDLHAAYLLLSYQKGIENPRQKAKVLIPPIMEEFLSGGEESLQAARETLNAFSDSTLESNTGLDAEPIIYDRKDIRLLAPVTRPPRIVCLSHNYQDFIDETGLPIPEDPRIFSKFFNSICGPEDDIMYPSMTSELGYEVELAFVVGKKGRYIPEEEAYNYIAGYTVFNDVSASDLTSKDKISLLRGKTFDNFAPTGPWLVTKDEIDDCHNLHVECRVNGKKLQESSTSNLIYNVPQLVSFLSKIYTLEPGDIVATGTPGGLAKHRNPQTFMNPGDICEVEVEKLGILKNKIVKEDI